MAWSRGFWPLLGVTYIAAGAAHFGVHKGFLDMYPHKGAWGFWYLPGVAARLPLCTAGERSRHQFHFQ